MTKHRRLLIRFSFIIFIFATHPFLLAQETLPTTAVLDFESRGVSPPEAHTLTDRFRTSIGNAGAVRLVERSLMDEILREQDFQLTGCTSDECAVEVGQLLGVQFMIGGSIGKIGETYTIDVRMISVETGASVRTRNVSYLGEVDGLIIEIEILAYEMAGLDPPPELQEQRRLGTRAFLAQQAESVVKTRTEALIRSMVFPGLGQIYGGRKVSGYGLLASELVLSGWIYFEYSKYRAAYDDHNRYIDLYRIETDHDKILAYKEMARESHDELSSRNSNMTILSLVAGGLWVANALHAYLTGPERQSVQAYLESPPLCLAYDPAIHHAILRLEFALD